MVVVGGIIGAGIFLNPAATAARTGSANELLVVWAFGGVLALAGALVYAELGARRPQAGGGYVYLREAFGPLVAFLFGWIMLAVNYSGSIAAVATTFASYACRLLGADKHWIQPLAAGAILLLTGINVFGIRTGAIVQNVLTFLKIVALVAVIVVGLFIAAPLLPAPAASAEAITPSFGNALIPALFTYSGWFYINNIAGEIKEPQRNIPRALTLGMLACAALYLLANLAYLRILGHAGLATADAPAATIMQQAFGPSGALLITLGVAFSTLGFCNIAILAGARVFQVMGEDGVFFRAAARLHPQYRTPHIALAVLGVLSAAEAASGTFGQLLNYSTIGDWLGSAMVVASLFYYRRRDPDAAVFRVPGHPFVPLAFVAAVAFVVISTTMADPVGTLISLGIIAAGVPIYFAWKRWA
jgi:APA family basic amino acid/polyamine antiporter